MKRLSVFMLAMALAQAQAGFARQRVDLSALDDAMPGPRAQVLVLGSVHLAQGEGARFDPASLEPVLQRLEAFAPGIITIEALSAETCELMRRRAVYKGVRDSFCPDVEQARAATGLDGPSALDAIDATFKAWPARPTPAQRRRLASVFLAAGEPASAMVQWWQLPEDERHAGDGLDEALVRSLRKRETDANENYQVAARLAARLGLQRLHAVDDHVGDNLDIVDEAAFEKAIRQAWAGAGVEAREARARVDALRRSGDMLATYRAVNAPEHQRLAIAADFGQALRDPSPERFGRQYVGGWEARNLRMVAGIRIAFREQPDARVLSLVGSSHKPWFDSLLGGMQGVEVVDAEQALR